MGPRRGVSIHHSGRQHESHDFLLALFHPNSYFMNPTSPLEKTTPHASGLGGEAEAKGLVVLIAFPIAQAEAKRCCQISRAMQCFPGALRSG